MPKSLPLLLRRSQAVTSITMEIAMHNFRILTLVAAAAFVFVASAHAQGVPECRVLGNWAGWGQNGAGTFEVGPGGSCTIAASTFGKFVGSRVAKEADHGTVKQLSVSSWQYTAAPGFTGTDSFVLEGVGQDPAQPSAQRSLVTMTVNVK
jgi:hypothetical protein